MALDSTTFKNDLKTLLQDPNLTDDSFADQFEAILKAYIMSGKVEVQVNGQTAPTSPGAPAAIVNQPGIGSMS